MSGCRIAQWMFGFAVVAAASVAAAQSSSKPNIIFILADDQGWSGTSVQMDPDIPESKSDYYQTPNLETLAARGMRFTNAYAAPACTMTRAAIQTGKSTAALQYTDLIASANPTSARYEPLFTGYPLTPPLIRPEVATNEKMIPEWLDENNSGYVTGHIGKWHIGNTTSHGYDYNSPGTALPAGQDAKNIFRYTNSAMQFLDQRTADDKPFFLQISHEATHDPIAALADTVAKYQALPRGTRHTNPVYAAMTENLDTGLGMILDKVQAMGIEDNTYIIYGSDNGLVAHQGATPNLPLYQAKGTVYEGGIRTPFIVAGPGITPGSVSDVPVQLQDIFATVAAIAGTPQVEATVESANLLPVLHNNGQLPGGVPLSRAYGPNGELFIHYPHYNGPTPSGDRIPASAIRDGDYKLVVEYGAPGQPDKVLLFNLAANVAESNNPNSPLNLANAMPAKTAELLGKLNQWLEDTDASMPYNIAENGGLHWRASQSGVDPLAWRSTNDVKSYFRERWESNQSSSMPTIVSSAAVPPSLGGQAFHFDGDDVLTHEFFRVSDARPVGTGGDFNRSASLVMTFRTDTLGQQQTLFESGDGRGGISLTLGDGDGDGSRDELRFRVLGTNLQNITSTITLTDFGNPTQEFVEATAIFNDSPTGRYVELYIDGTLASHVEGIGVTASLDWDRHNTEWVGYIHAGLGGKVGNGAGAGLGANGGTGDLPFTGFFRGDVASLDFYNYVIDPLSMAPNADFNGDGSVDGDDLTNWRNATVASTDGGDADGDGDSDGADFLTWQRQVSLPVADFMAAQSPEPAGAVLSGLAAMFLLATARLREGARTAPH